MKTDAAKKSGLEVVKYIYKPASELKAGNSQFGKLDPRHWKERLLIRFRVVDGREVRDDHLFIRIQHNGRRGRFDTGCADKTEAAREAVAIFKKIISDGWDEAAAATAEKLGRRRVLPKKAAIGTVGALLGVFESLSTTKVSSTAAYSRSLRKLYGDLNGVGKGRKYDNRKGGNKRWRASIDALPLDSVNAAKVMDWKRRYISGAEGESDRRRRITTANSMIRNAKAVFARRLLPHLREQVALPVPLPFEGVIMEKASSTRYRSRTDATAVLAAAREQLKENHREAYKVVCLALCCGLRRAEIDSLLWKSVDFVRKLINVESNEFYELKSQDSHGEIDLGDTLLAELVQFKKQATSTFVVESTRKAVKHKTSGMYRCNMVFDFVTNWLRQQGVSADRPLHELRKEVGSVIAQHHGIFAASRFLRHSDIRVTSEYYLDKKQRIVPAFS